jgi:hypothetical protein
MTIYYPSDELASVISLRDRLEILMDAAERYKTAIVDQMSAMTANPPERKRMTPKEIQHAYNWQEIAKIMREVRELGETTMPAKALKADSLTKLAEVYEVLRGAKMPKLEAVRLALMNEATQLNRGVL